MTPLTDPKGVARAWVCTTCGRTFTDKNVAQSCCVSLKCKCGEDCRHGLIACDTCRAKNEQEALKRDFDKAEKIPFSEYKGTMLCRPGGGGSADDYVHVDYFNEPETGWMWACEPESLPRISAYDLILEMLDEWFEDAIDNFDTDSLQEAIDAWQKKHERVLCYREDRTRVVITSKEEEDRLAQLKQGIADLLAQMTLEAESSETMLELVNVGKRLLQGAQREVVTDNQNLSGPVATGPEGKETLSLSESFNAALNPYLKQWHRPDVAGKLKAAYLRTFYEYLEDRGIAPPEQCEITYDISARGVVNMELAFEPGWIEGLPSDAQEEFLSFMGAPYRVR